jgi:predicted DNA-binding transcriptional regulator AlpA
LKPNLLELISAKDLPLYGAPSRSQREKDITEGKFPPSVRLSERRQMWVKAEIIAWQQQKLRERDQQARAKRK